MQVPAGHVLRRGEAESRARRKSQRARRRRRVIWRARAIRWGNGQGRARSAALSAATAGAAQNYCLKRAQHIIPRGTTNNPRGMTGGLRGTTNHLSRGLYQRGRKRFGGGSIGKQFSSFWDLVRTGVVPAPLHGDAGTGECRRRWSRQLRPPIFRISPFCPSPAHTSKLPAATPIGTRSSSMFHRFHVPSGGR